LSVSSSLTLALRVKPPAITLPELASSVENMSRTEREALLIKGAREEREVMFYGTTPGTHFAVLRKSFKRALSICRTEAFYGVHQVVLNKAMSEFRAQYCNDNHPPFVLSLSRSMNRLEAFSAACGRYKFDLLISSVVTVAHEKVYEVTYADR
jgi:hypothetical protein